jgi:hypothetical protein
VREPLTFRIDQWSAPMWQAFVVSGADRAERARRLAMVPEHWRARVASHVQTVFEIRKGARPGLRPDRAVTQPG